MDIFLTNGRTFLGPYGTDEIRARARGYAYLRAEDQTAQIHRVEAGTMEEARRKFRARR